MDSVYLSNIEVVASYAPSLFGLEVKRVSGRELIVEASFFRKIILYLSSFIFAAPFQDVQRVLQESVSAVQQQVNGGHPLSPEAQRCIEKCNRVASCCFDGGRCGWGLFPHSYPRISLPLGGNPAEWQARHAVNNDSSLMRPHQTGGGYYYGNEGRWSHIWDAVKIFFYTQTNFRPFTGRDLRNHITHMPALPHSEDLQVQWIGHATSLVQMDKMNILIDPIFGNLSPIFYPRMTPPGLRMRELPLIHTVLISHNHKDHMDEESLLMLRNQQPLMMVPEGDGNWFRERGFTRVQEHSWWSKTTLTSPEGRTVEFTFVPAKHWSQNHLCNMDRSLWGGWVIEGRQKLYYSGDTAYDNAMFAQIRQRFTRFDAALLPIGPCNPRELEGRTHIDPREAVRAFRDVGAGCFFPVHWGTFMQGTDQFETPLSQLEELMRQDQELARQANILRIGQRVRV